MSACTHLQHDLPSHPSLLETMMAPGQPRAKAAPYSHEEPGYPLARQVFEQHATRLMLVPVDPNGLCVEQLPEGPVGPMLV